MCLDGCLNGGVCLDGCLNGAPSGAWSFSDLALDRSQSLKGFERLALDRVKGFERPRKLGMVLVAGCPWDHLLTLREMVGPSHPADPSWPESCLRSGHGTKRATEHC